MKVSGFRFSGLSAGIKKNGKPDLGLIVADQPVVAAGSFTRNVVRAAPVVLTEQRVRTGKLQAVVVNSGNANACNGASGMRAAKTISARVAKELGIAERLVVPASTGVIGVELPTQRIIDHIPKLVAKASARNASKFAKAIMTTDQYSKSASASFRIGMRKVTLFGAAKGAGMIHPDMATLLAFVMSDAAISPAALRASVKTAVDQTFNRMSVDGDTSTNDTLLALASGAFGNAPIKPNDADHQKFTAALSEVLEELGKQIISDGEGAEHLVRIDVIGAPNDTAAAAVARTIAGSQLVKTAIHGNDPNWGRILAAAGRAGVRFDANKAEVSIGGIDVFKKSRPVMNAAVEKRVAKIMKQKSYSITVDLRSGRGKNHYWTCDLGHTYVSINADYRS